METIGPIDADTLRPARTLLAAKIASSALVLALAVVLAVLLAPNLAAGLGLAPSAEAVVTAVEPVDTATAPTPDGRCEQVRVTLTYDGDRTGFIQYCQDAAAPQYRIGARVPIRYLPGWERVVAGSVMAEMILVAVELSLIVAGLAGLIVYPREWFALRRVGRRAVPTTALGMQVAHRSMVLGRRAVLRLVPIPAGGVRPLRVTVAGVGRDSVDFHRVDVHPLRRTRRGTPAGPYVLRRVDGSGTLVGLGRRMPAYPDAGPAPGPRHIRAVGAIITDPAGRLLLVQRGHEPARGQWTIPGGKVEPGETDEQALIREIAEETGLPIAVGPLAGTVERPGPDGVVYLIHDYRATIVTAPDEPTPQPRAADDAADVRWVSPAEMTGMELTDGLIETLRGWGRLP